MGKRKEIITIVKELPFIVGGFIIMSCFLVAAVGAASVNPITLTAITWAIASLWMAATISWHSWVKRLAKRVRWIIKGAYPNEAR